MSRYYASYKHYRDAWKNAYYFTPPIPLNLDIELTTFCNLQCPFCFTTDRRFRKKNLSPLMSTDMALQLIDEADAIGIPALKFNWRGESTLHKDFTKIMQYAASKRSFYDIIVNTNGNIPDHALNGLLYTTKVIVSLDAFGKDIYAKMRRGGDIRTVVETVNKLIAGGHNNIWVRRVITKQNNQETYYNIAHGIWGNKVNIAEHYCFDRNAQKKHALKREKKGKMKRTYCGYPSQRLLVATSGKVFPCCVDYYETMQLGRYPQDSLLDIWRSEKLQQLRYDLKREYFDASMQQCQKCTSYMAYDVQERQYVQDRAIK